MNINSDLLKNSVIDGIIYANNFKCKNWFIPTLYSGGSSISRSGVSSISLSGDEYTFVANATDMYFGQVSNPGAVYTETNGILYDVSNMKKISFNITNSAFNTILITTYNSSKISLGYGVIRSNKGTYTIPSGAKYMTFRFGKQDAVAGTTYKTKVQIETGDVITDYTPYKNFENDETLKDTQTFSNEGISWGKAITYETSTDVPSWYELITLTLNPKKTGVYLINYSIPVLAKAGGTPFLDFQLDGARKHRAYVSNVSSYTGMNAMAITGSFTLSGISLNRNHSLVIGVSKNNSVGYKVNSGYPITVTAIEV